MNPEQKITAILNKANETTGEAAADLTQAVQTLCNGFGQGGVSTINGRTFDYGTFILEADQTVPLSVAHALGTVPSAVFLYVVNPPFTDENGEQLRYQYGKYRNASTGSSHSATIFTNWGTSAVGVGANANHFRLEWTDTNFILNCSSTYPLRAGLTYEWIALGDVQG